MCQSAFYVLSYHVLVSYNMCMHVSLVEIR